jgi:hypothetical protein
MWLSLIWSLYVFEGKIAFQNVIIIRQILTNVHGVLFMTLNSKFLNKFNGNL